MLGSIIGDVIGSIYEVKEVESIKNSVEKIRSYEENNDTIAASEFIGVVNRAISDKYGNKLYFEPGSYQAPEEVTLVVDGSDIEQLEIY